MRSRTGPQMSPLTTACVAVSTETVSSRVSFPSRSRHAVGSVRQAAPVSTSASLRMRNVESIPFSIVA